MTVLLMRSALLAGATGLMSAPLVAAEALTNGGFEAPVVAGPCCITSPPTDIPGWTATPNVNVVNGTFASSPSGTNLAKQGNQYLDLVGEGGTGSISQTFTTVVGQIYNLNFWYSHNLFSGLASASARLSVVGSGTNLSDSITHSSGNNTNLDWRFYSGAFTADSTSTTLRFVNTTGAANEGVFLDAVSVLAVPEPSTWAMLILGFGVLGGAMRRRVQATAFA
jgi:hypothetical protein